MLAPDPGKVARDVVGAMVAGEPIEPLAWATARKEDGTPIYMVAVIMGSENCTKMNQLMERLQGNLMPVDVFDGTEGEPLPVP